MSEDSQANLIRARETGGVWHREAIDRAGHLADKSSGYTSREDAEKKPWVVRCPDHQIRLSVDGSSYWTACAVPGCGFGR